MTLTELKYLLNNHFIPADIQKDNHGQIVIYTGMMVNEDDAEKELVPFEMKEDILDL